MRWSSSKLKKMTLRILLTISLKAGKISMLMIEKTDSA